jgi:hypothetical protein
MPAQATAELMKVVVPVLFPGTETLRQVPLLEWHS